MYDGPEPEWFTPNGLAIAWITVLVAGITVTLLTGWMWWLGIAFILAVPMALAEACLRPAHSTEKET